jgi:hypothetical protein
MEGVRAVVEVIVAAARVDAVAMRRLRRIGARLRRSDSDYRQQADEECTRQGETPEAAPLAAPPCAVSREHRPAFSSDHQHLSIVEITDLSAAQSVPAYSGSV